MVVKINTATFTGIEGIPINVEVDINRGLPNFNIVGMADTSIKESKDRVRSAIINSGFEFPLGKITVNLAPADIKKEGALFDLPIAIGILCATEQIKIENIKEYVFLGELSLVGELKKVKGALPIVVSGIKKEISNYVIPIENKNECSMIDKANIYPFNNLIEVINFLQFKDVYPYKTNFEKSKKNEERIDFLDVIGQESAKRALEVAAAGNHNVILYGPPGTGKTMLAQRVTTILPEITYEESLECTKIYSVAGYLDEEHGFINERPFREIHNTSTKIALIGGGRKLLPGEISLAHNGVLFLDEILEFNKGTLESLRQPIENRKIKITRSTGTVEYPCNCMLIASLNPCPCSKDICVCTPYEKEKYINKLSRAFLDRIDIYTSLSKIQYSKIKEGQRGESSKVVRQRINSAREIQRRRFKKENILTNGEMDINNIMKYCKLDKNSVKFMEKVYKKFNFSTRVYSRILKVSRTIADLDERENIIEEDLIESLQYRRFLENIV